MITISVCFLQLQQFSSKHEDILKGASREMRQVLEHVTANVAWMEEKYDHVVDWLNTRTNAQR